jgi:hypothetical protein
MERRSNQQLGADLLTTLAEKRNATERTEFLSETHQALEEATESATQ